MSLVSDNGRQYEGKRCRGNLKPAPFELTDSLVAIALGDKPPLSTRVVHLPVLPIRLVDLPRRSENPRLARANDDTEVPA